MTRPRIQFHEGEPSAASSEGQAPGGLEADWRRGLDDIRAGLVETVDALRPPDYSSLADQIARAKQAEIAREEALVREMSMLRRTVERSAEREAAAYQRAAEAEERERLQAEAAARREQMMLRLTAASTAVAFISAALAIFT